MGERVPARGLPAWEVSAAGERRVLQDLKDQCGCRSGNEGGESCQFGP